MSIRVVKRAYKYRFYPSPEQAGDRFYPSSKTCSACGVITAKMPLNVREWVCAACGASHDRDVNAAKVLSSAALLGRPREVRSLTS